MVNTIDGLKPIENIKTGELVLSFDEKTKTSQYKKVLKNYRNETKIWYHIITNDDEIICTPTHPFYVKGRGYVEACLLTLDDVLVNASNRSINIVDIKIEELEEYEITYNLEVDGSNTYYVGYSSILVHNICRSTQRTHYWKDRANDSNIYSIYDDNSIKNMFTGHAPTVNGEIVNLHHVKGFAVDPYDVVEMTSSQHTLFHKTYSYDYEKFGQVPIDIINEFIVGAKK